MTGTPMDNLNVMNADQAPTVADALRLTEILADHALETLATGQPVPDDQCRALATGVGRLREAGVLLPQSLERKVEEISERTAALVNTPCRPIKRVASWALSRLRRSRRSTPAALAAPERLDPAAVKESRVRKAIRATGDFAPLYAAPRSARITHGSTAECGSSKVVCPTPIASKPERPAAASSASRHLKRLTFVLTAVSVGIALIVRRAYRHVMTAKAKHQPQPISGGVDHAAEAHAFFSREIVTPPQIKPQAAANANALADFYEPVELALKQAGYLR